VKDVFTVKKREGEGTQVHLKTIEEREYQTLKLSQIALVFFVGKKNGKKYMVQDYRYLNE